MLRSLCLSLSLSLSLLTLSPLQSLLTISFHFCLFLITKSKNHLFLLVVHISTFWLPIINFVFQIFYFWLCVCTCIYVWERMHEGRRQWRTEDARSLKLQAVAYKLPKLGCWDLNSLLQEQRTPLTAEASHGLPCIFICKVDNYFYAECFLYCFR